MAASGCSFYLKCLALKHKKRGPEAALSKFSLYIQNIKLRGGVKWQFLGIYICLEINGLQEIGEVEGLDKIWLKTLTIAI